MRDFYLILNTTVAVTLLILGVIALINNRRLLINKLFLAFTICVGIWLVAAAISNDVRNSSDVALYGKYCVFVFSYLSSYLLLWFSALISESKVVLHWLKLLLAPAILVGIISATPLVVQGVELQDTLYGVVFGPLVWLYGLTLITMLSGSLAVLFVGVSRADSSRNVQLRSFLWSLIISVPILLITQFIAPSITGSFALTDIGILVMALPVASLYLSVIKHGLFDIRLAAVRSIAYVGVIATLSLLYYFIVYSISYAVSGDDASYIVQISPISIGIALVLGFLFQPIRSFFDHATSRVFYRNSYDTDAFFSGLSELLVENTSLRDMLDRTGVYIQNAMHAQQVYFYVFRHEDSKRDIIVGSHTNARLSKQDACTLAEYVNKVGNVVISVDNLLSEDGGMYRLLRSNRLDVVVPLVRGGSLIGYLCLGQNNRSNYTQRDTRVLRTVADELVIAVQNALAVQQVRDLNENLQQRIDDATRELRRSNAQLQRLDEAKDEFVSMASHQLRTPLTSVKGYIDMVLEGDAGEITDMQKHLLSEAFTSSERMVHLINDFLNVSRLQTGKFIIEKSKIDMRKLIAQEVESLQVNASQRNMKFKLSVDQSLPVVMIDEGKIRQVIMNFLDNALYYSKENTTIHVQLKAVDDTLECTVKDTGIGVPEKEQSHLFTKFYRASNARKQRPDGTGVGLFLAKRVVSAHGGQVIFSSVEGKGSTFGFSIPLTKIALSEDRGDKSGN